MKKWIENLGLWLQLEKHNILPALKLGLLFLLLFITWKQGPTMVRKLFVQKMDAHTTGIIDTIIYVHGFQSSKLGERPVIKFYRLRYHFNIGDSTYHNEESIAREILNYSDRAFLIKAGKGDSIGIKYQKSNPSASTISFDK